MNTPTDSTSPFTGPIRPDWTIEDLIEWFAVDDARLSDASLRKPLRRLEEALTGTRWTVDLDSTLTGDRLTREPAIISLVRSIALHASRHPALRAQTIGEVLRGATQVAESAVPTHV